MGTCCYQPRLEPSIEKLSPNEVRLGLSSSVISHIAKCLSFARSWSQNRECSQLRQLHIKPPSYLYYTRSSVQHGSDVKDVWDALTMMDVSQRAGRIVLLYSGYEIPPGDRDEEYRAGWNREHVWPRSHGNLSTSRPGAGTDLHNLYAADISVNSNRGNKDFDDLSVEVTRLTA